MAAVSAWSKPGAWALDSEAHDAAEREKGDDSPDSAPAADFPSLAAAAAKPARKKKPQTLSLAEFTTGHPVSHGASAARSSSSRGLTSDELLSLPTGPRERSAEELERSSRGFGYSSGFGPGRGGQARGASEETRRSREPSRDLGPSRADEIDDWGAAKKSAPPPPMHERRERSGGFFDSPSRADESDSWVSKKSAPLPSEGRRITGSDGPRERRGGFEMFNREGMDSETWGRKREETNGSGGERRRLVLQPRTLPLANGNGNGELKEQPQLQPKSRGSNPFGEARPREDVLAEKGQDWKKIDEKLESVKIKEAPPEGASLGKKGFEMGDGSAGYLTERSWRKAETADVPTPRF